MSNKLSEEMYIDKEIVWVKLGRGLWWPGEVCSEERLPDGLLSSLKNKPISIVRFFNEDQFEFVKSLANICKYNNPRKHDFIKKGLDSYRAKHKHVEKFPDDIELAERLTNGDPKIISRKEFQPHSRKSVWADIFNDKKQSKTHINNKKTKPTNTANALNRSQLFRKSFDHEVRILTQPSTSQTNSYSSNKSASSEQIYRCHLCDFSSKRVNVVMLHSKSHVPGSISNVQQHFVPQTNITPVSTLNRFILNDIVDENEIKKVSSDSSENDEAICIIRKDIILPKKRGRPFRKESIIPADVQKNIKSRVRGKRKFTEPQPEIKNDTINVDILNQNDEIKIDNDDTESYIEIVSASKKSKTENKVEFKKKLLEDWVEDDSDGDTKSPIKSLIEDIVQPDNSLNSTCEELDNSKDQKENKTNHIDRKDNFTNSNTITKYRNIPKKDRKREFIFDESISPTQSTELHKSEISTEIRNVAQHENNTGNEMNNLEHTVNEEMPTQEDLKINEDESKNFNKMSVKTTVHLEIIQDSVSLQKHVTESIDPAEIKIKHHISADVVSKDNIYQELDSSADIVKTQIPKPSEITCFDFQDDDDIEFAKSPPRRQRNRKSANMSLDNHNKLVSDIDRLNERDNDIQKQTEMILQITDPPQLPEVPILLSVEHLNTSDENIISGKKEHSLPPKERGKRIFKSRNRNKISIGNQSQLIKSQIDYDVEKDDDGNSASKPTESDLLIAETLINIPSRSLHTQDSSIDENTIVTTVISDSYENVMIDNVPIHVSRKKHLQAAFRAEEEQNQNKDSLSIQLPETNRLTSIQSPQLTSVPANSPKQKVNLKLNEDSVVNNSNKFEPRTPKKRKPTPEDIKAKPQNNTTDENVFDINNMEIVISNDVIQNEPFENIQSSIVPIVIQTMSDDVGIDPSDEIKKNYIKKISKNIKVKTIEQPTSPKLESMRKSIAVDAPVIKKPKLNIKKNDTIPPVTTNISTYKKSQIIQATAGGQIVITSKGQLLTTNSQTQLTSSSQICETTVSCEKSISSTKSKESTSKIQVQSQKIIYPSNKIKSNKTKLIDKNNTDSPNKVKMSLQSLTEMTKLGYIKEKGTERIITTTGLKRIKQHLLTGSKDRIPPLTQNIPSDASLAITASSISQLALQLPTASKPTETIVSGGTAESHPQIISSTALTSTTTSTSEITENYYACAAESFGGPPNSFYLCRAGENNTFVPIDNRALYLDANNRLVEDIPDIINTFDTISNQNTTSTSAVLNCEQVSALDLNSSNSDNIQIQDGSQSFIINTLDGQQIILDQQSFLSLAAGEMPHLITADGQQIILQGSPQDIITAITVNQQEIGIMADEQHIIIPQCERQSTLGNNDIISIALEGSDVYQQPESLIGDVIIQNTPHSDIVANQSNLPTATATVLSNPIMSTLEVPTKATAESNNLTLESGLNIDDSLAVIGVNTTHSNVPSSLELPITVTNPAIASKTSPLSLNTIYTPTMSSIGAIGQITQISPSLGYDIFDTSSSSSSSKGTAVCLENNGNLLTSNITISQLNSHAQNLNLSNSNGTDNDIDEEMENGNIIPQSPEIEINISSVNDAIESPLECVNYDDNSDNSDEIPIQPNLIIYNNKLNNNTENNGHEMINLYDNNRESHNDDVKQPSQSSNINNDKDDRR